MHLAAVESSDEKDKGLHDNDDEYHSKNGHCIDSNDAQKLIQMTGEALQEAKRRKNTYKFFTDALQKSSQKRLGILRQIREGLNENAFELYYQPIVNKKGRLVSAEALLRLRSRDNKMINPDEFIPVAESSGLIYSLSEWVLERAVIDAKQFRKKNKKFYVSINLSVKQFTDPNLYAQVEAILKKYDFPANGIRFEITEYSLADDIEIMGQNLRDLIKLGVHFSIDDFGTGFSSMSYLKNLPAKNLKIDKSFVENIQHSGTDRAIVCSIIELARGLSMKVFAEGVENKKQLDFLISNNCDYIQGYYYGKPVSYEDFVEKYLENTFENVITSL